MIHFLSNSLRQVPSDHNSTKRDWQMSFLFPILSKIHYFFKSFAGICKPRLMNNKSGISFSAQNNIFNIREKIFLFLFYIRKNNPKKQVSRGIFTRNSYYQITYLIGINFSLADKQRSVFISQGTPGIQNFIMIRNMCISMKT